jgi:prepilin-type N-terminal cleavage/methylation domain-containing protein
MKTSIKNKGVTLVEMLITIAVTSIILAGSLSLFKVIFSTGVQKPQALTTVDQARKTVFNFVNELRNANTSNTGAYPINLANDTEIIFFSGYGASTGQFNRIR